MQELSIEWRHYDKEGATCERCAATGSSVGDVVTGLREELAIKGIKVIFTEKKLAEEQMAQSNLILFNGVTLEEVLDNAMARKTHCSSCSCLTGSATDCRTVEYEGINYEAIPAELIRTAAYKSIEASQR